MLLVTVLAHELGHHITSRYGCASSGPLEELQADQLSVPLIAALTEGRLAPLHDRMLAAADAMIAAVPIANRLEIPRDGDLRAWVAAQSALPKEVPSYVTLHLSRQRRLLAEHEPFAAVAKRLCLAPFASRMASRSLRPGKVRTLARGLPQTDLGDQLAIDPLGHVWAASGSPGVAIRRLDGPGPLLKLELPDGGSDLYAFAAYSEDRFAIADFAHVWVAEHGSLREVGSSAASPTALAFDATGELYAAFRDETSWKVESVGPTPGRARFTLQLDPRGFPWADGPLPVASASPGSFAMVGAEVVFADRAREAIRGAGPQGIFTLAGSLPGRRDGGSEQASFFAIEAIGALSDGRIAVVESDFEHDTRVLRVIERSNVQ